MRIALLAVMLNPTSRATNVARVLEMIDRAGGLEPAPDLIVVPAGCDRTSEPDAYISEAMSESYWASLSAKAREWGVYLAAGQQRFGGGGLQDIAVLLDADGDEIVVHRVDGGRKSVVAHPTLLGSIGMCFESETISKTSNAQRPTVTIVFDAPCGGSRAKSPSAGAFDALVAGGYSFVCRLRASVGENGSDGVSVSPDSPPPHRLTVPTGCIVMSTVETAMR